MNFQACAYCTHPNPEGSNYCNHCGAALHLKPCHHCGAVAVADALQCPACKLEFPHRPTINVDIPWAATAQLPPAYDPPAVKAGPAPRLQPRPAPRPAARPTASPAAGASHGPLADASSRPSEEASRPPIAGPAGEAAGLAASAEVLAVTQRLIEKASSRMPPSVGHSELVFPGHGDGERHERRLATRGQAGSPGASPDVAPAATAAARAGAPPRARYSPMPVNDIFLAEEPAALQVTDIGEADETAVGGRWAPLVFLSLLGLVAAIGLIYLVRYAGDGGAGPTREIASPHRLLLPASRPAAPEAAAEAWPLGTPASFGEPDVDALPLLPADGPATMPSAAPPATAAAVPAAASSAAAAAAPSPTPITAPTAVPAANGECRPELQALNLCGRVNPTR